MANTLVSIIIPCYNAAKTLRRTLNDLFTQSYQPLEIIAVNDGSTDETQLILESYRSRIIIINQNNKGAPAARNAGFKISHGAYVLFCDADVRLKKDMITKMVTMLEQNPDKAYCYSNFRFGYHTFDLFPFDPERLRKENYISTMSLIRRPCFIGFDETLKRLQDWDLWKRMLDRGHVGIWYPERLFSTSLSRHGISKFSIKEVWQTIKHKIARQK